MRRAAATFLGLVCLLTCPGCLMLDVTPAREDVVAYQVTPQRTAPFRRVLLAPLHREDAGEREEHVLRQALAAAMTANRIFEVVPISRRELADIAIERPRTKGTFGTEDLLELSRRFGVDGVLTGTLSQFRVYPQMQVGLRLHLIDCRTGRVAWGTDSFLDAADPRVARDAHNYYDLDFNDRGRSLAQEEKILISPRLFSRYTAARVADTLAQALRPRPAVAAESAVSVSVKD
jgi:hypothetical protein